MVWSSESDDDDMGWTLEANRHRPLQEARKYIEDNGDELWTLYQCILDKCSQEGYPFFTQGRLSYQAFVAFVLRHS